MDQKSRAEHPPGRPVRFSLFGGARVERGGVEIEVTQPKQRAVLSLLLATPGDVVSLSEITQALWSGEPAASVTNQIHRHVGLLRRICQPGLERRKSGDFILASGAGYRLVVAPENCDVLRFRGLVVDAQRLAQEGRRVEALARYLESLRVAPTPAGDEQLGILPVFVRLEDERAQAIIAAADQCEEADEFASVLPLLRAAAGRHPLNEALHAHLITALARTGRTAEALVVYAAMRETLMEELGATPSTVVENAQAYALRGEEPPPFPDKDRSASSPATAAPAQLPSAVPGFAGRRDLLAAVCEPQDASRPLLITGMAGVGKTTLALRAAHELSHLYPDGQLYMNLRGFDATAPPTDPLDALRDLLEGLGIPAPGQPVSAAARSGLFRSILSEKQVLILLDNARDFRQVEPLLPGTGTSRVIITSRNQMPSLSAFHQAQGVELEPFDDGEVVEFFSQRLPLSRSDDRAAMIRLGQACGGLPLALSIVSARASANPAFPLDLLFREFARESTPLAALSAGTAELDLGNVFSWSRRGLSEDAAHTFVVLSVHPGPEISTAAAVSMSGLAHGRTRDVLTELSVAHLIREVRPDRFAFHDLMRQHALSLLADQSQQPPARLVNHYVRSTRNAILTFGRPGIAPVDSTPGVEPERFDSQADAIRWYVEERRVLQAVCRLALASGDHRSALLLILDWRPMSQTVDARDDMKPWAMLGLEAAEDVAEPALRAECYREAAAKFGYYGDREEARNYFARAAAIFDELGDLAGLANVYRNMSQHLAIDARARLDLLHKSVFIARDLENPPVLAAALYMLGYCLRWELKDFANARKAYEELLAIARTEHLADHERRARIGIVDLLSATRSYEEAVNESQPILALLQHESAPLDELGLLAAYGDALTGLHRHVEAIEVWRRFLEVATPELASELGAVGRSDGAEVIAAVRSKLEALLILDSSDSRSG